MGGRLARLLVRAAALAVPPLRRSGFVREWEAELWHEAQRDDGGSSGARQARHALGAFADARAIGNLHGTHAKRRGASMTEWIAGWGRETKLAVRGLLRNPGFTSVAVFILALGMGASAAIYTLLDRIVLDPLPYPEPDRLVEVTNQVPGVGEGEFWNTSTAQYVFFSEHAGSLEEVGVYRGLGANIDTPEGPQRTFGWRVTASVFDLIGAEARLGRVITPGDDRPGGPNVVVLSHGFWQRQFGGDPDVLSRTITLVGQPYEVIGVLEPGVAMPEGPAGLTADLWLPLQIDPEGSFWPSHVFSMIGRLAPGTDPDAAETEIARLTSRLPERFPQAYSQSFFDRYGFRTTVTLLKDAVLDQSGGGFAGDMSRNLWILFGAVGLVLVIAVANVANLFLVRMEERSRELAIRSALGAGRGVLARHLLAEGLTLSLAGGVTGLLVGYWGVPALLAVAPEGLPRLDAVQVGGGTVAFTLLLSLIVGIALAAYPLLRHVRPSNVESLPGGGQSTSAGRRRQMLRSGLVVGQVALALTLVVGAGLILESMRRLGAVDPGFDPEGVLSTTVYLDYSRYDSDVEIWQAYQQMLERIEAIPGVTEAGMSEDLPLTGEFGCTVQGFEDRAVYERLEAAGRTPCAGEEPTTPGYFEAMGIPVVQGRTLTRADMDDPGRGALVVSRAFAERFWPGEDPIGKGVAPRGMDIPPFHRVVGVVGDVPAKSLDGEPAIAVYYPITKHPNTPWSWRPVRMSLVVRTALADPLSLVPSVRRAVREVDPSAPVTDARSMEDVVARSMARLSFVSVLLGVGAAVALILAAVGLYGVVAYVVSRRTREIGMRIAIGAQPGAVERLFVRRSMVLVAGGLALGVAVALATTRVMESLLYGVEPTDPVAFAGAAAVLVLVALVASWIPARRASRVDPVKALRAE